MCLSILSSTAHTTLRCVCTGLQRWRLPDAWGHGLSILTSPASPAHTTLRCVCTGLRRWRLPGTPHILRSAAYVRGYRDSVFQTHGAWALYPHIPASPAHTTLRCVCPGLQRWCLLGTPHILRSAAYVRGYRDSVFQTHWIMWLSILASPYSPHILRSAAYVRGYGNSVFQTHKTEKASDCSDAFSYFGFNYYPWSPPPLLLLW